MKRALVFSLICVLGVAFTGFAASLSGSWDTDVKINPQSVSFADAITLTSVLTVAYTVGDWTFTSVTTLSEDGWTDQDFAVAGVLGAFTIGSALDFTPATPAFGSWVTTASVSIAGVSFSSTFTLDGTDAYLKFIAGGVAGDVTIDVTVNFGAADPVGCELNFTDITIALGYPFCCADITSSIKFDCEGFDNVTFAVTAIAIPNLPWVTLDALITFTMQTKSLVLTPKFDFGTIVCFDLYFDVFTGDPHLTLGDITIEGIGLSCNIGEVTFTGLSFWGDGTKPGLLYGTDYWEVYSVATTDDACCGPFTFDVSFYFLENGVALFDVALIDANMTLKVATQFMFNMGLEINVDTGHFTEWTIGFLVTW